MRTTAILLLVLVETGCAARSSQFVRFPAQDVPVEDPSRARIYVMRPSVTIARTVAMYVKDGRRTIEVTGPGTFLCWERDPGPAVLQSLSVQRDSLVLTAAPGRAYYVAQSAMSGGLELLDPRAGQATLASCAPPGSQPARDESIWTAREDSGELVRTSSFRSGEPIVVVLFGYDLCGWRNSVFFPRPTPIERIGPHLVDPRLHAGHQYRGPSVRIAGDDGKTQPMRLRNALIMNHITHEGITARIHLQNTFPQGEYRVMVEDGGILLDSCTFSVGA